MTVGERLRDLRADHHGALLVADALVGASAQTAPGLVGAFLEFFDDFSWEHLVSEEAELLPAVARVDPSLASAYGPSTSSCAPRRGCCGPARPTRGASRRSGTCCAGTSASRRGSCYPRFDASPPAAAVLE